MFVFLLISMTACASDQPKDPKGTDLEILNAVIEKTYEKTLYVRTADKGEEYFFVSRCDTVTQNGEAIAQDSLEAGDTIQIVYDGVALGSSPAQIANVFEIILTVPSVSAK